jgi:hypothetical protein
MSATVSFQGRGDCVGGAMWDAGDKLVSQARIPGVGERTLFC